MVAICAAINLLAADIIVTRSSQRIEAKIMEVSSSEIKYKEAGNPDGPTFVLSTDEINTIIYANGTVKVFDHAATPGYSQQPANRGGYSAKSANLQPITKSGGNYYLGDKRLTDEQYCDFIRTNCRDAWDSYNSGNKLWKAGWSLFGVGLGLDVLGTGLLCGGVAGYRYNSGLVVSGSVFLGIGGGLVTASVPCIIVGGIRKYNSHDVYNKSCASGQMAVTFGIQASQNGLGLAVNF